MAGITFSHPLVGDLELRLPPTEVNWSYDLVTARTPTYAGEVVQVLSVAFDKLNLTGQFGKEGAHGTYIDGGRIRNRASNDWNTNHKYGVGLVQMTAWFREYFSIASQGVDSKKNYDERPVTIKYQGAILDVAVDYGKSEHLWKVYPVSFPSYRRSHANFAPEWKVECEVAEPDASVAHVERDTAIERLSRGARWQPMNPYSDPLAQHLPDDFNDMNADQRKKMLALAEASLKKDATNLVDYFNDMIPTLDADTFRELLTQGASAPIVTKAAQPKGRVEANDKIDDPAGGSTHKPREEVIG